MRKFNVEFITFDGEAVRPSPYSSEHLLPRVGELISIRSAEEKVHEMAEVVRVCHDYVLQGTENETHNVFVVLGRPTAAPSRLTSLINHLGGI